MGGVAIPMPKIFTMFSSFSMASLALPGMSGFVAEVLVFLGIITSQKYLLMPKIAITFVMAIGMILTPIYLLSMSRQIFYGYKLFNTPNSYVFDSGPRELFVSISIFISVISIGMYLDFVLSLSVDKIVSGRINLTQAQLTALINEQVAAALAAAQAGGQHAQPPVCTFKTFMDYRPTTFNGTEGAVGLLHWFEKLESVFEMCECPEARRVKYATGTLEGVALTW
ncbi:putative NADH:ubiquinone oxidoreductase [Helianthus annuus]|nr:putative NADH:ubiquinone oxidoreductase [Helianthus annuus]